MRRKGDKTIKKNSSKNIENVYDKALSELNSLGIKISKYIQPSQKEAEAVNALIKKYRLQSKKLEEQKNELDSNQKVKLVEIRNEYERTIEGIKVQLPSLIAAQKAANEKNAKGFEAQRLREEGAKEQCDALVLQLNTLATQYADAPLDTSDALLTQYNRVKSELQLRASALPIAIDDNEGKRFYTVTSLKTPDRKVEFGTAFKEISVLARDHREASDRTRKPTLEEFRRRKTKLYQRLQQEFPNGSDELNNFRGRVTALDQQVRKYDKEADKLKKEKDLELQKKFEENRKKMKEITQSTGLIGALFHVAPKNVQDGLNYLASNPNVINTLAADQGVRLALGDISLQEGFKQITYGAVDEAIAQVEGRGVSQRKFLSAEDQVVVIDAAIKALIGQESSSSETKKAIEALQFMRRAVVGMQRLANKEVSHLSFILRSGESVFITHLGVADALNNPESLFQVVNSLGGAEAGDWMIEFCNQQQAALLSILAQYNFVKLEKNTRIALNQALTQGSKSNALVQVFAGALAELGGGVLPQINTLGGVIDLVLLAAGNSNAMAQLFGTNSQAIQKRLVLINKQFAGQTNVEVTPEQMLTLVEGVGAILTTLNQIPGLKSGAVANYYNSHLNPNRLPEGGTVITVVDQCLVNNPVALNLLAGGDGNVHPLENGARLTITSTVVSEGEKLSQQKREEEQRIKKEQEHIRKLADALVVQKVAFDSLLEQLGTVISELYEKADDDDNYKKVAQAALNLHYKLEDAKAFFNAPTLTGFQKFQEFCRGSIEEAAEEFSQHRGLWHSSIPLILKGFLGVLVGVLATVTVVSLPLLIVERKTYIGTFFSTPETTSSKKLGEISSNLKAIEKEIKVQMAELDNNEVLGLEMPSLVSALAG